MDYKKAIETLRPMADNYALPGVADALETAIRALEEVETLRAELAGERERFDRYADYSVERDKMIEQLKEELRGDAERCRTCGHLSEARMCDTSDYLCCECGQNACACRTCTKGSEWKWRGAVAEITTTTFSTVSKSEPVGEPEGEKQA